MGLGLLRLEPLGTVPPVGSSKLNQGLAMHIKSNAGVNGISCAPPVDAPQNVMALWPSKSRKWIACRATYESCPAARSITFGLSFLKHQRRNAIAKKLRRRAPSDLKNQLVHVFGGQCQYCGTRRAEWTIDRIVPQAKGGTYEQANVTLACKSCNSRKCALDFVGPVRSYEDAGGRYV